MNGATVGFVLLAATFDDPENARIILLSAAGLVLLGALIAAGTVWWWRSSEVEHPALGPLEVMGSRAWWRGDYALRRRRLEAARPPGAEPADAPTTSSLEPVDLEAASLALPREFDDLLEFPPATSGNTDVGADLDVDVGVEGDVEEPEDVAQGDEVRDETAVPAMQRPIDPLLRVQREE